MAKEDNMPPAGLRKEPFPELFPPSSHDRSLPQFPEQDGEVLKVGVALRHAPPLPGMAPDPLHILPGQRGDQKIRHVPPFPGPVRPESLSGREARIPRSRPASMRVRSRHAGAGASPHANCQPRSSGAARLADHIGRTVVQSGRDLGADIFVKPVGQGYLHGAVSPVGHTAHHTVADSHCERPLPTGCLPTGSEIFHNKLQWAVGIFGIRLLSAVLGILAVPALLALFLALLALFEWLALGGAG